MGSTNSTSIRDHYTTQSATTDPGDYAYLLDNLPTDLADIAAVTQGLIYHNTTAP